MITEIGLIILPFSLFFIINKEKYLYYLLIFSVPFTSTAFFLTSNGSSITVTNYITFLLFIKILLLIKKNKYIYLPGFIYFKKIYYSFSIFLILVFLSILMPIYINGNLKIFAGKIQDIDFDIPVFFTSSNFFKLLPIISGYLFVFVLLNFIRNSETTLKKILKIYIISIIFSSFWGLYQFFSIKYSLKYFSIFNNFLEQNQMIYGTILEGGSTNLIRISSTTQEPSHFAQILLTILPTLFFFIASKIKIFTKNLDILIFFIIFLLLLLSTSTTALIGIFIFILFTIFYIKKFQIVRSTNFSNFIYITIFTITIIIFFSYPDFFNQLLLEKSTSGSALERLYSIQTAWSYFMQYPILGIGWGVATSHDLFIMLLSNCGILGTLSFIIFNFYLIKMTLMLNRTIFTNIKYIQLINIGFNISLINFLLISIFVEFTWYLNHFYLIIAILITTNNMIKIASLKYEN